MKGIIEMKAQTDRGEKNRNDNLSQKFTLLRLMKLIPRKSDQEREKAHVSLISEILRRHPCKS